MKNRLKRMLLFLFLSLLLLVSGCWDQKELEEKAYVVVIGLDKSEIENRIGVTFQITNPQVGTSQRGEAKTEPAAMEITYLDAPDVLSAKDTANTSVTRTLTFEQAKMIVASEELARSDQFARTMYSLLRDPELRRGIHILITKEKASEFLKGNNPLMETRPHKHYQFMIQRSKETGLIPESDLHKFLIATETDADLFLAMYGTAKNFKSKNNNGYEDDFLPGQINKKGGNPAQLIGSAVFKEGKMIGALTGEETRLALKLNPYEELNDFHVSYKDPLKPNYRISAKVINSSNVDIKMDLNNEKNPKIMVTVPINVEILGVPSFIDYAEDLHKQQILKESIEKGLVKKTEQLVKKTQEEFKGEPFQWSVPARRHFSSLTEFAKYDWMKTYPTIDVIIRYEIKIQQFGKQLKNPEFNKVRD